MNVLLLVSSLLHMYFKCRFRTNFGLFTYYSEYQTFNCRLLNFQLSGNMKSFFYSPTKGCLLYTLADL